MVLKFYYDFLSQPCRAVMIFLKVNNILFEPIEINLGAGEQYSKTFGQVNRFRKLPVIRDGDFTLTESIAILRYLSREKDVPDHWYSKDSKKQACVDEYLEWQHLNTRLHVFMYVWPKFFTPLVMGQTASPKKVAEVLKQMEKTLDTIENKWLLDGNQYLVGNRISIADLLGACEIEQSKIAGYDPTQGRPKIAAWLSRVQKDTHPFYDESHLKLWSIVKKHKGVPPASFSNL